MTNNLEIVICFDVILVSDECVKMACYLGECVSVCVSGTVV